MTAAHAFTKHLRRPAADGCQHGARSYPPAGTEAAALRCMRRTVVTRDGVRLAVRDYGFRDAAHTVVLLHGLCLTAQSWHAPIRGLIRAWGDSVRIISYDHRGHGESDEAPMSTYRIDQLAADLTDVLVDLNVAGSVTLAGHSMGGMTALAFCGQHPGSSRPVQPHGLVLVAAAAGRLAERGLGRLLATPATGLFAALVEHAPAAAADRTVRALVGPVCELLGRSRGYGSVDLRAVAALSAAAVTSAAVSTAAGFLPNLRAYNQYDTLGAITAATVVVSGGADLLIPPAHALELVAGIPGAIHVHRPAAGHMLLHDAAHVVTQAISHVVSQGSSAMCTNSPQGPLFPPPVVTEFRPARHANAAGKGATDA